MPLKKTKYNLKKVNINKTLKKFDTLHFKSVFLYCQKFYNILVM